MFVIIIQCISRIETEKKQQHSMLEPKRNKRFNSNVVLKHHCTLNKYGLKTEKG